MFQSEQQQLSPDSDLIAEFDSLAADVDLYYKNLLAFVETIENMIELADFQQLLAAYERLADVYYWQFRESLLARLQALYKEQEELDTAVAARKKSTVVKDTLQKAYEARKQEYHQLLDRVPSLLQDGLSKLTAEWERVYQVIIASRTAHSDINALLPVVYAASHSVGIDGRHLAVIPQISNDFALQFFNYADNFTVLMIPIYTLKAPWEWSILWHEMAGYQVRWLKESGFEEINRRLTRQSSCKQALHHAVWRLRKLEQTNLQDLNGMEKELAQHAEAIIENMLTLAVAGTGQSESELRDFINQEDAVLTTDYIHSFHGQMQQLRRQIWQERGYEIYDQFLDKGWCEDWLEEVFEDAFSASFFGEPFPAILDRILKRFADGGKGLRHPPREERRRVAEKVIELANNGKVADDYPSDTNNLNNRDGEAYIISLVARQIHCTLSSFILARQMDQTSQEALQTVIRRINEIATATHIVQPGDTLFRIGLQYGFTWQELAEANRLVNPRFNPSSLYVGQELVIAGQSLAGEDVQALWQERPSKSPKITSRTVRQIRQMILEAMESWLDGKPKQANDIIQKLSRLSGTAATTNTIGNDPEMSRSKADSFIEMIKAMDYINLLSVNFTDIDFNANNFITIICAPNQQYKVLASKWSEWEKANPPKVKIVVPTGNLSMEKVFTKGTEQWAMTNRHWEDSYPQHIKDG